MLLLVACQLYNLEFCLVKLEIARHAAVSYDYTWALNSHSCKLGELYVLCLIIMTLGTHKRGQLLCLWFRPIEYRLGLFVV